MPRGLDPAKEEKAAKVYALRMFGPPSKKPPPEPPDWMRITPSMPKPPLASPNSRSTQPLDRPLHPDLFEDGSGAEYHSYEQRRLERSVSAPADKDTHDVHGSWDSLSEGGEGYMGADGDIMVGHESQPMEKVQKAPKQRAESRVTFDHVSDIDVDIADGETTWDQLELEHIEGTHHGQTEDSPSHSRCCRWRLCACCCRRKQSPTSQREQAKGWFARIFDEAKYRQVLLFVILLVVMVVGGGVYSQLDGKAVVEEVIKLQVQDVADLVAVHASDFLKKAELPLALLRIRHQQNLLLLSRGFVQEAFFVTNTTNLAQVQKVYIGFGSDGYFEGLQWTERRLPLKMQSENPLLDSSNNTLYYQDRLLYSMDETGATGDVYQVEDIDDFDPRTRPWWTPDSLTLTSWTSVYSFPDESIGLSVSWGLENATNQEIVIAADISLQEISDFLSLVRLGDLSVIFIYDLNSKEFVASSTAATVVCPEEPSVSSDLRKQLCEPELLTHDDGAVKLISDSNNLIARTVANCLLSGETPVLSWCEDILVTRFNFDKIRSDWAIIVAVTPSEFLETSLVLTILIGVAAAAVGTFLFVIVSAMGRSWLKPFKVVKRKFSSARKSISQNQKQESDVSGSEGTRTPDRSSVRLNFLLNRGHIATSFQKLTGKGATGFIWHSRMVTFSSMIVLVVLGTSAVYQQISIVNPTESSLDTHGNHTLWMMQNETEDKINTLDIAVFSIQKFVGNTISPDSRALSETLVTHILALDSLHDAFCVSMIGDWSVRVAKDAGGTLLVCQFEVTSGKVIGGHTVDATRVDWDEWDVMTQAESEKLCESRATVDPAAVVHSQEPFWTTWGEPLEHLSATILIEGCCLVDFSLSSDVLALSLSNSNTTERVLIGESGQVWGQETDTSKDLLVLFNLRWMENGAYVSNLFENRTISLTGENLYESTIGEFAMAAKFALVTAGDVDFTVCTVINRSDVLSDQNGRVVYFVVVAIVLLALLVVLVNVSARWSGDLLLNEQTTAVNEMFVYSVGGIGPIVGGYAFWSMGVVYSQFLCSGVTYKRDDFSDGYFFFFLFDAFWANSGYILWLWLAMRFFFSWPFMRRFSLFFIVFGVATGLVYVLYFVMSDEEDGDFLFISRSIKAVFIALITLLSAGKLAKEVEYPHPKSLFFAVVGSVASTKLFELIYALYVDDVYLHANPFVKVLLLMLIIPLSGILQYIQLQCAFRVKKYELYLETGHCQLGLRFVPDMIEEEKKNIEKLRQLKEEAREAAAIANPLSEPIEVREGVEKPHQIHGGTAIDYRTPAMCLYAQCATAYIQRLLIVSMDTLPLMAFGAVISAVSEILIRRFTRAGHITLHKIIETWMGLKKVESLPPHDFDDVDMVQLRTDMIIGDMLCECSAIVFAWLTRIAFVIFRSDSTLFFTQPFWNDVTNLMLVLILQLLIEWLTDWISSFMECQQGLPLVSQWKQNKSSGYLTFFAWTNFLYVADFTFFMVVAWVKFLRAGHQNMTCT